MPRWASLLVTNALTLLRDPIHFDCCSELQWQKKKKKKKGLRSVFFPA